MDRSEHPQNPYKSYVVEASAGSGKTYQLSHRFLKLVSAGSSPQNILTITFTVKAAAEMKARIISEASDLLLDHNKALAFEKDMTAYFEDYSRMLEFKVSPPKSAQQTAKEILAATQVLRVSTIDALFHEWVAKFPNEASFDAKGKRSIRSFPVRIMKSIESESLNEEAWQRVFALRGEKTTQQCMKFFSQGQEHSILALQAKVAQLFRHHTYLWQIARESDKPLHVFEQKATQSFDECFAQIHDDLVQIVSQTSQKDILLEALSRQDYQKLWDKKLLTQRHEVSKTYVRGKKRELLFDHIERVSSVIQNMYDQQKLGVLNTQGQALFQLYTFWLQEREWLKSKRNWIEFHDLAFGNYQLFHSPEAVGATWLIQKSIQHLLIDEFQDTSFLQWSIFKTIVEEKLSGENSSYQTQTPSTVFLVGDEKQSIYGFREAEPLVIGHAKDLFTQFGCGQLPLHCSYRSAKIILDFVNEVFQKHIDKEFPTHIAAQTESRLFIPNHGQVTVCEEFVSDEQAQLSAVEVEANFVAKSIKDLLSSDSCLIYDKKSEHMRPLKLSDCAVLYRSSTHVPVFEKALQAQGLACQREEKKGYFERCEIQDMIVLLKFFFDPGNVITLCSLLKTPFIRVNDQKILDLLDMTVDVDRRYDVLFAQLKKTDPQLVADLEHLLEMSNRFNPFHLLQKSYECFEIVDSYSRHFDQVEGLIAQKNLIRFLELVLMFEKEGYKSLDQVLEELDLYVQQNDLASASVASDAIKLMTIHKAKGLEFPFVALIEASEQWFRLDRYWSKVQSDKDSIAYVGTQKDQPLKNQSVSAILKQTHNKLHEEAQRLLYVALTRASHYLLISAHASKQRKDSFYPLMLETIKETSTYAVEQTEKSFFWQHVELRNSDIQQRDKVDVPQKIECPYTYTKQLVPEQLSVKRPHEHVHGYYETEVSAYPAFVKSLMGQIIHSCLSDAILGNDISFEAQWEKHYDSLSILQQGVLEKLSISKIKSELLCEIELNIKSPVFDELVSNLDYAQAEKKFCSLKSGVLLQGSCDLFVVKKDGDLIIVEWKTHKLPSVFPSWEPFANRAGFAKQLSEYLQVARKIYPHKKIIGWLWFTKASHVLKFSMEP